MELDLSLFVLLYNTNFRIFVWLQQKLEIKQFSILKKHPFKCSEHVDYPRSCLPSTFCKGGGGFKRLPLPYPKSSACADHLIILIQMNGCLPEQFLPGNWIPMKRTAVTRTAYYLVTLGTIHSFLCTCTMLILT